LTNEKSVGIIVIVNRTTDCLLCSQTVPTPNFLVASTA
jgi:hypothetical protein